MDETTPSETITVRRRRPLPIEPYDNWDSIRPGLESRAVEIGLEFIGHTVRRMRLLQGLSQTRLGLLAGVHQSTISRLEHAQLRYLHLRTLARILGVLDDPLRGATPPLTRWS